MEEEKFVLRMPKGARDLVRTAAEREFSSMNGYIMRLVGRDVERLLSTSFPSPSRPKPTHSGER